MATIDSTNHRNDSNSDSILRTKNVEATMRYHHKLINKAVWESTYDYVTDSTEILCLCCEKGTTLLEGESSRGWLVQHSHGGQQSRFFWRHEWPHGT